MAMGSKPPMLRQHVTWESMGPLGLEILTGTFRRTQGYCVTCGKQGTWASGGNGHCTSCGKLQRLAAALEPATGFWRRILVQLP